MQTATVNNGAFSSSFDTASLTVAGSPYTINYSYAGDGHLSAVNANTTLTVAWPAPVFSGLSAPTITYGTPTTTLSGSVSLVPSGQQVSITLDGVVQTAAVNNGTFSSTFNTSSLGVSGSPYTIAYAYAGDASLSSAGDTSHTLTVTAATPAFSGLASPTIVYGTPTTTISGAVSLVPNGESVSITLNGVVQTATVNNGAFSSTFNTSALGVAKSPYTVAYSYAGDGNLALLSDTSATLTVTTATPAFSSLAAPTISYGTATTTLSGAISLVPNGEQVAIALDGVVQSATVNNGTFSSSFSTSALGVAGSPYTIGYSYGGDANLAALGNTNETLTVTTATPAFSSLAAPTIATGAATTVLSGTISLVPDGETVSITLDGVTQTATVAGGAFSSSFDTTALTIAGSPYTITYAYLGDANLAPVSNTSASLSVVPPAPAFSGLSSPTISYGTLTATLSGTISLVPDGESLTISLGGQQRTTTVSGGTFSSRFNTSDLEVSDSPYTITYSYAGDGTLSAANGSGSMTVVPAPLTITAVNQTMVYGGALPSLTASYSGFVDGDTSASLSTQPTLSTTATAASHVNTYAITGGGAADANYTISYVAGTLSVTPAPLTITANNATKVYGSADPTFSVTGSGFVHGDSLASLGGTLTFTTNEPAGSNAPVGSYTITPAGLTSADYNIGFQPGALTVTAAPNPGPVIGPPAFNFVSGFMSWNESDAAGVTGASLAIDGKTLSKSAIYGPYAATSGVVYVGVFGTLAAGSSHSYTITATDKLGHSSQLAGTFTMPANLGPVISGVAFNFASGMMSWNEADPSGVSSGALMIDGKALSRSAIYGPYTATSGMNYAGVFGMLTAGSTHTYTITATDKPGYSTQLAGTFTVPVSPGPAISQIALNFAAGLMSWNESDASGVAGGGLSIDGKALSRSSIYGPYAAASGVNYVGVFGTLAAGSTHSYTITATDKLGNTSTKTGQFTLPAGSGPAISQIVLNLAAGLMSWNEADPSGVTGGALAIDGHALGKSSIYGPYTAPSGVNYAGIFGTLAAGSTHSYTITATDKLGNTSTTTAQFTVPASSGSNVNHGKIEAVAAALNGLTARSGESAKVAWLFDDAASDG